jgi:peptidoglycan/LPS O-acetylase OafA/YrhL
MTLHAPAPIQHAALPESLSDRPARGRRPFGILLRAAGIVAGWAAIVCLLAFVWHSGFDYPTGDAIALSIGLMTMIAMLVTLIVSVIAVTRREDERLKQ